MFYKLIIVQIISSPLHLWTLRSSKKSRQQHVHTTLTVQTQIERTIHSLYNKN